LKITALKTYVVAPRWLFLKVETDAGISGWGEPVLEGHAETLATKIAELGDFVIGLDPRRVEDIWQLIYRNGCYRGGPVLMSALISRAARWGCRCTSCWAARSATAFEAIAGLAGIGPQV
jgi:L-alanine-DL-glutamate epimerase-like enolase superfamily enzyme